MFRVVCLGKLRWGMARLGQARFGVVWLGTDRIAGVRNHPHQSLGPSRRAKACWVRAWRGKVRPGLAGIALPVRDKSQAFLFGCGKAGSGAVRRVVAWRGAARYGMIRLVMDGRGLPRLGAARTACRFAK